MYRCLHVTARVALLTDHALVDAMAGLVTFGACVDAPVRVGTFMCSAVCAAMRLKKCVRTKKRVATVCFFSRDRAHSFVGLLPAPIRLPRFLDGLRRGVSVGPVPHALSSVKLTSERVCAH